MTFAINLFCQLTHNFHHWHMSSCYGLLDALVKPVVCVLTVNYYPWGKAFANDNTAVMLTVYSVALYHAMAYWQMNLRKKNGKNCIR